MKDLHGGNIYKFQREGKNDILDYSSNINPLGVPQKFIDIAKESFDKLVCLLYTSPSPRDCS